MSVPRYTDHPSETQSAHALTQLALDLRWAWNHAADELWRRLDPELWELTHNPWVILQTISQSKLDVHYGAIHALRGVSFEVTEGEIVTLIGANGAGKTTTLRAVSGMLKPSAGGIRYAGAPIAGTKSSAKVLGANDRVRIAVAGLNGRGGARPQTGGELQTISTPNQGALFTALALLPIHLQAALARTIARMRAPLLPAAESHWL